MRLIDLGLSGFAVPMAIAAGLTMTQVFPTKAQAQDAPIARPDAKASGQLIERTMSAIKSAKRPLPTWAFDMAMRAYQTYRTFKNGQRVEEAVREVAALLRIVDEIRQQVEAGREMTDREFRLTRELLDAHERHLLVLTGRLDVVERKAAETAAQVLGWRKRALEVEWRIYRRGCGTGRAWRNGRCVDVAASPR